MLVGRRFPLLTEFLILIQCGGMQTKSSPGTCVGRRHCSNSRPAQWLPLKTYQEMFTCWAFAFGFLSFLPALASCVVLDGIGEGLALAVSFHGEPSECLASVVLSNSALQ